MTAALCLGARVRHRKTGRIGLITRDALTVVGHGTMYGTAPHELAVYEVTLHTPMLSYDRTESPHDIEACDVLWPLVAADLEVLP